MSFSVPNYKILSFEPDRGIITINFEGYPAGAYQAPVVDNAYLSGDDLDKWIKTQFVHFVSDWGTMYIDYASVTNSEAITAIVDGAAYPVTMPYPESLNIIQPVTNGLESI